MKHEPYKIKFEHREKYLYASVSGAKDTYEISCMYWLDILTECKKFEVKKLMVVEDFKNNISITDMYSLVDRMSSEGIGYKVAFIDKQMEQFATNKFAETAAMNRGMNMRLFTNPVEAEKWLIAE